MRSTKLERRDGDADLEPVRQHFGAACHGGTVAAGLADHGSGFAGNRALVDRSHALDHFAVAGNEFAGLHDNEVADPEIARRHLGDIDAVGLQQFACGQLRACAAQRVGLSLAATFGDGFREVREQHGEP